MIVKPVVVSMFATNCYLVGCPETNKGMVIDPGAEGKRILAAIKELGLEIEYILNTHGHIDHVGANARLKEALRVPLLFPEKDLEIYRRPGFGLGLVAGKQPAPDRLLREGDRISCGNLEFAVLETPGHTAGGVCLRAAEAVFTGDTIFAGSIGRTDLAGGSFAEIMQSIREKLMVLPPQTVLYPGHGPATTVAEEARSNPFIRF